MIDTYFSTTGYIGKLRFSKQLIRHNVANESLRLAENWVQEGFLHLTRENLICNKARTQWQCHYGLILNYGLGRKPIIAQLSNSYDSEGRAFPALFFQELHHPILLAHQYALPILYQKTLQHFAKVPTKISSEQDFLQQLAIDPAFLKDINERKIRSKIKKTFSAIELQTFATQLVPTFSVQEFISLLQVLLQITKKIGSQGHWQINLPIASGRLMFASLSFWLTLINVLGVINYRNMHLVWDIEPRNGKMSLRIYHGLLSIAFFRSLLNQADTRIHQVNPSDFINTSNTSDIFTPDTSLQTLLEQFAASTE